MQHLDYISIIKKTGSAAGHMRGRGLTDVIKSGYYPNYVFSIAVKGSARDPGIKPPFGVQGEKKGRWRGNLVDHQVQAWIKGALKDATPSTPERKAACLDASLHQFSRAFIELTQRLELTPIGTQVVVQNEQCNIATLVDAVFLNTQGHIVLVELKTGFDGYNDASNGDMNADFAFLSNAPANQHQIQLAFTQCMFESTFKEFGEVHAVVIRMTDSGAHVTPLDRRIFQTTQAILQKGIPL